MIRALAILHVLLFSASAYLLGDYQNTYCWKTDLVTGSVLQEECPSSIVLEWIDPPSTNIKTGENLVGSYRFKIADTYIVSSVPEVSHANLHACATEIGQCSPLTSNSDLISSSAAKYANLSDPVGGFRSAEVKDEFQINGIGDYILISHTRFEIASSVGGNSTLKFDVAIGQPLTVTGEDASYLGEPSEIFIVTLACITYICLGLLTGVICINCEKTWMRDNLLWMVFIQPIGGVIFVTTVFFWNLYITDVGCILYPIFANVGYSLLFSPLIVKTIWIYAKLDQVVLITSLKDSSSDRSFKKKMVAAGVVLSLLILDIVLISVTMAYRPPSAMPVINGEFRSSCNGTGSTSFLSALFAIKGMLTILGCLILWWTRGDGVQRLNVERVRYSMNTIFISGAVALIIELAFREDPQLNFIVRSLSILTATIGGVSWIYYEWSGRLLLARITMGLETNTRKRELSFSEQTSESQGLTSMSIADMKTMATKKAFDELFETEIIRGYLLLQSRESHDSESVEFCSAVIQYQKNPTMAEAREIVDTFITDESPKCVNISSKARKSVLDKMQKLEERLGGPAAQPSEMLSTQPSEILKSREEGKGEQLPLKTSQVDAKEKTQVHEDEALLARLFKHSFKEVRHLIYLNNWRPFRESDHGLAAASWFQWLEYMNEFSLQEQKWVSLHIENRIKELEQGAVAAGALTRKNTTVKDPKYDKVEAGKLQSLGGRPTTDETKSLETNSVTMSANARSSHISFARALMARQKV
mmetsp:Transcript_28531/g.39727  ORF Transcript_28531/g.39727 Transcript_28531/m.39727 type:complete len:760 (-) Transcript_28531:271-2550(-)|eukprot:CAMPEP_0184504672 /NCGR_PEP_ID=MMETSP0113_2-20130426/52588_1 /TAXON_ID=91329 /ORGANISM="Norrisiella sphaerica, Strain BC52" /LENGTH=759 /DNA_ID=CAMNT_0026894327 /DNA_START=166 /DNA_END=2445 /DNA_ORIENTATION=+